MQSLHVKILVADADRVLAEGIARSLRRMSYTVEHVQDGQSALQRLATSYFDVLVLEVALPGVPCAEVLDKALSMTEAPLCFLLAEQPDLRAAVEAMRRGASDYTEKPVDIAALTTRIERALQTATMRRRLTVLQDRDRVMANPIAESTQMQVALKLADRVAASPSSSALILGESGVGKEVVATRIHERSKRKNAPFVRVNMAAIPEAMIEAELFGSVRGAYTDSKRDRAGFFASADGGTLLLDEICEFKIDFQAKLLRILEERRFFPVGSDRQRSVDVRVLAATNREPEQAIAEGRLRADLFYRLSPITIRIPALRERPEDVVPLARRFLALYAHELGAGELTLSQDAERALREHHWPGNARELRNTIERAAMLADSSVVTADLLSLSPPTPSDDPPSTVALRAAPPPPPSASGVREKFDLEKAKQVVEGLERDQILQKLKEAGGSRTQAAKLLGVSRTTLWEKLKRYGLA